MVKKLLLVFLLTLLSFTISYAKQITLYDQPATNAKKIGIINAETGLIPIFNDKTNTWVKVGDPSNGNVGWIQSSDLAMQNGIIGFTFTQKTLGKEGFPQTTTVQFGQPQNMSPQQMQEYLKKLHVRQFEIQQNIQEMLNNMYTNQMLNTPMVMPVIFIPQEANKGNNIDNNPR